MKTESILSYFETNQLSVAGWGSALEQSSEGNSAVLDDLSICLQWEQERNGGVRVEDLLTLFLYTFS